MARSVRDQMRAQVRQQAALLARRRRGATFGAGRGGGGRQSTGGSRFFDEETGRYRNFGLAPRRLAELLPEGSRYADRPGAIRRAYARRERREERREMRSVGNAVRSATLPNRARTRAVRQTASRLGRRL